MKGFPMYGKGKCRFCGRIVGGHVPKGGDGSAIRLMMHKDNSKWCEGRFDVVDWVIAPGKHCRDRNE